MPNLVATRTAPWIGIGTSGQWDSSEEALAASRLDFTVRQEDLFWRRKDKNIQMMVYDEKVPMYANIRDTDDMLLGCVTPQYKIIQNHEAFSLLDPFLGNGKITHAGMTMDGLCFMVAEVSIEVIGGEEYTIYLMASNSFNTKYPCQIIMTPVRIICQNMYRRVVNDRVFLAKHTLAATDRLTALANSGVVEKRVLMFSEFIRASQTKALPMADVEKLVAMMFPYPKEAGPKELAFKARADRARKNFVDVYFDAVDNRAHQGTAFGFINAYYDWLSHRDAPRGMPSDWNDRRFAGMISGIDIDSHILKEAMK